MSQAHIQRSPSKVAELLREMIRREPTIIMRHVVETAPDDGVLIGHSYRDILSDAVAYLENQK